jgi:hypothetical protein
MTTKPNKEIKMKMTKLENKVYDFIKENSDPETMDCVNMKDLVKGTGENAKVLRGVIGSLIKKDLIELEDYDTGFQADYFYWLKGAFDNL